MNQERFALRVNVTRSQLIEIENELAANASLSLLAKSVACSMLAQVIDQLPPRRDTRVNIGIWQIAMLAAALVDVHQADPEVAVLAAIQTLAPERENDAKFREFANRNYRHLRNGKNPARSRLLDPGPDLVQMAAEHLPKR